MEIVQALLGPIGSFVADRIGLIGYSAGVCVLVTGTLAFALIRTVKWR